MKTIPCAVYPVMITPYNQDNSIDRHAVDTLITAEQAVCDMIEEDSQNETSSGGI